ncbi:hypothetical protein N7470_007027 [Penicillium chermesinum]|nr:hypothetical protein N7470_007027 [Penicillium chermesinum]
MSTPNNNHTIHRVSLKRTRQACAPCRSHVSRKKARCPGEKPACSLCQRLRQRCSYESPALPRGRGVQARTGDNRRNPGEEGQDAITRRFENIEGRLDDISMLLR